MDINEWLSQLGFDAYIESFAENEIDEEALITLTAEDLKDLGVSKIGHRRKLMNAIAKLTEAGNLGTVPASQPQSIETKKEAPSDTPMAVSDAKSEAERRHLTVMFVDMVGSTKLSTQIDAEEVRDVITCFQNTVAGVIGRFEGFVARFMGDGVLCYFGWPRANEDDAERAVRAGLSIIESVNKINTPDGAAIATRVGIASGLVIVGDLIGSGASEEAAVVGETPNLAARLQGVANPGQVVIANATRNLVGELFIYSPLGNQDLKGIKEPTPCFTVEQERVVAARFEAKRSGDIASMVGRDQELGLLIDRWRQSSSGQGQMVLLTGEAGIGKSRIVQGVLDELADKPHTRIRYQCSPYHTDTALYPVSQQLTLAAGFDVDDTQDIRLDKLEKALAHTGGKEIVSVALLASLIGLGEIAETRHGVLDLTPEQRRNETLGALTAQLFSLSKDHPVLFVLEDVHWIDPTTMALIERCLEQLDEHRVLILITARPTFQDEFGGHPNVTRLALNRLGRDQIAGIVSRVTKGKPLPEELISEIVARTDGVPLFIEELTKTIIELPTLRETETAWVLDEPLDSIAIPSSIHDSLMARLDHMESIKEVAQVAACIGREFAHGMLSHISPLSGDKLQQALTQLMEAELLFRRGTPPDASYIFKHALVRDAAYQSLLNSTRRGIHAHIADRLQNEDHDQGAEAALLAFHCREAGRIDDAVHYFELAGRRSIERSAHVEAIAHLNNAIALITTQTDTAGGQDRELRIQTMLAGPLIATKGYGAPETGTVFARALELSAHVDDPSLAFPVLYQQWVFSVIVSKNSDAMEQAKNFLNLAEKQTRSEPLLLGHRLMGVCYFFKAQFAKSRDSFKHALALYDPDEHRDMKFQYGQDPVAACQSFLSVALLVSGSIDEALAVNSQTRVSSAKAKHSNTFCYATYFGPARLSYLLGDVEQAARDTLAIRDLAKQQNLALWLAYSAVQLGWVKAKQNKLDEALDLAVAGFEGMTATRSGLDRSVSLAQLSEILHARGEHDAAREKLEEAVAYNREHNESWFNAEIHRLLGITNVTLQGEGAGDENFRQSIDIARDQGALFFELRSTNELARSMISRGEIPAAHDMLRACVDRFKTDVETADLKLADQLLKRGS